MRSSIRKICAVATMAGGLVLASAAPAVAGKPFVFDQGEFDDTFVIPGGVGVCDFPVQGHEVGSFKTTVFFDKDGETRLAKNHANGVTEWSALDGDVVVVDRWVNNSFFELPPGAGPETPPLSVTTVGNPWNVHGGAGGVLVNDSGRVVFDADDNIVSVSGPHQALFGDFGDLCDVLGG